MKLLCQHRWGNAPREDSLGGLRKSTCPYPQSVEKIREKEFPLLNGRTHQESRSILY